MFRHPGHSSVSTYVIVGPVAAVSPADLDRAARMKADAERAAARHG
ncbi:hypothetical protein [Micromonospora sp. HUAS LYJ1]|nr:hypothetical protein [Micromonospora sp. HUAS LYJ1]WKU02594.1 hypothetical protein Q2K16_16850 [Micromonospora sp. HUAS LYJ1]